MIFTYLYLLYSFYSDFGPLKIAMLYRYCLGLQSKLMVHICNDYMWVVPFNGTILCMLCDIIWYCVISIEVHTLLWLGVLMWHKARSIKVVMHEPKACALCKQPLWTRLSATLKHCQMCYKWFIDDLVNYRCCWPASLVEVSKVCNN